MVLGVCGRGIQFRGLCLSKSLLLVFIFEKGERGRETDPGGGCFWGGMNGGLGILGLWWGYGVYIHRVTYKQMWW
ncbi:hypothetical protein QBC41DRAFT_317176 [Cercophora samala]|uniref:Uncharacterized protein n=1 Tax=Cercophora samala TaxID=330535 RepID=A0AA39ZGP3_9PEZI|nr:hypothetical protein QBC41DRAFT_317176 [Cercophora samala]